MLNEDKFKTIIQNTPLISIDLIINNDLNQVLLGQRVNEPARNYWFVPGGRVFKDETLENAFKRLTLNEIGIEIPQDKAKFLGVYEHFYDNNFFNTEFSTHYVVLAYKLKIDKLPKVNSQHHQYMWFNIDELLKSKKVHKYTKNYFK